MKILVLSDSHQKTATLEHILKKEAAGCDMIVHLGDGAEDLDFCLQYTDHKEIRRVRGNNDPIACGYRDEQVLNTDGLTVFICHGHRYAVYFGLTMLSCAADEKNADICLYGHTHAQKAEVAGGTLFMNPGAVMHGQYALLFIENVEYRYELKTF